MGNIPDQPTLPPVVIQGGAGSVSSERDCIFIGRFTPENNVVTVRLSGIGKNPMTKIDSRQGFYVDSLEPSIIGVIGDGRADIDVIDSGDDYAYLTCICETGEVRGRAQTRDDVSHKETLRLRDGQIFIGNDFYTAIHDVLDLSGDLVWTFKLEKPGKDTVILNPKDDTPITTANQDTLVVTVTVDWPDPPRGVKQFSAVLQTPDGNSMNGNPRVFIGNPFAFAAAPMSWPPDDQVTGAMVGVKVLSVEYGDSIKPVVTAFQVLDYIGTNAPIAYFDATDNTGVAAYMVTVSEAPPTEAPAVDDAGWSAQPPRFVGLDTGGTVYPWVKDAAGNVNTVENAVAFASTATQITIPS